MTRVACLLGLVWVVGCGSDEKKQSADGTADATADSGDTAPPVDSDAATDADTPDDSDTGPVRTPLEAALYASAAAVCERAPECLPFVIGDEFGGSVSACTEREYDTLRPILDMPGIQTDPAKYAAVATLIRGADCETVRRGVLASDLPATARVAGTLANGSPCVHPYQCASSSCRRTFDQLCGTCETPEPDGADCTAPADCAGGSTCAAGKCAAFGEHGDPCDAGHPCYPHDACLEGKCAAALGEGAECTTPLGECDLQGSLLVCGLDPKTCMPITWAEVDQPCGFIQGQALACAGSACLPSPFFGVCTAYAADGAECDPTSGPACAFHASCIDGHCVTYYGHTCE